MIHLIYMPLALTINPSLALGQIKAQLNEAGMESRVFNLNLDFAGRLGIKNYEIIALTRGYDPQIGEWLFAKEAWGEEASTSADDDFLELCGSKMPGLHKVKNVKKWGEKIRTEVVPEFLDFCCKKLLDAGDLEVVGFSCAFFQTIASIALIRRLKQIQPSLRVVCGGSCFHGEIGEELISKVPEIDAVSIGEADDVIVPLFRALYNKEEPKGLHSVLYRKSDGKVVVAAPSRIVTSQVLEKNPDPDYDEYFEDINRLGFEKYPEIQSRAFLPFESSRGCWWGQKHQCTFCGLNNEGLAFRAKSSKRTLETFRSFLKRYPLRKFYASDLAFPMKHYKDLLPELKEDMDFEKVEIFYEIRAKMNRKQAKLLSDAGVYYIQPGIDALTTHLLNSLSKGVKAIYNIHCLKLCRTFSLLPLWNLMIRVPGERIEDYSETAALIPKIIHFIPPFGGPREIELHRHSPYFNEKGKWTQNVRPVFWYEKIYPGNRVNLPAVAYYFDAEWKDTIDPRHYKKVSEASWAWIDIWRNLEVLPQLKYFSNNSSELRVTDTREIGRTGTWNLDAKETMLFMGIDDPATPERLRSKLGESVGSIDLVESILKDFVSCGIAVEDSGSYLNLALPEKTPEPSLRYRRSFLQRVGQDSERPVF